MKLKANYVVYPVDDHEIMLATGKEKFHGMIKLNKTASFIVSCLSEETDEEEIVAKLAEKYDAEKAEIKKDLKRILDQLREIGAIEG